MEDAIWRLTEFLTKMKNDGFQKLKSDMDTFTQSWLLLWKELNRNENHERSTKKRKYKTEMPHTGIHNIITYAKLININYEYVVVNPNKKQEQGHSSAFKFSHTIKTYWG